MRALAPDLARGGMLLLIAIANVNYWGADTDTSPLGGADRWWILLRTILVDDRAYPLFGLLFGFGLGVIAQRVLDTGAGPQTARRLLWRRCLVLFVIGAVHAQFYPGDVLGTYALAGAYLAPLAVGASTRVLVTLFVPALLVGAYANGEPGSQLSPLDNEPTDVEGIGALTDTAVWLGTALASNFMSVVAAMGILGILISRHRHLRVRPSTLLVAGLVGVGIGAVAGLPYAHILLGDQPPSPLGHWHGRLGWAGALGWLALLTWWASKACNTGGTADTGTWGVLAGPLAATGRRSLSAYLLQTVLFALILPVPGWGAFAYGLVAVAVWAATVVFCCALDRLGWMGPAEWLVRRLSYAGRSPIGPLSWTSTPETGSQSPRS